MIEGKGFAISAIRAIRLLGTTVKGMSIFLLLLLLLSQHGVHVRVLVEVIIMVMVMVICMSLQ